MFTRSKHIAPGAAILSTAGPESAQTSTIFDPVGDTKFNAPPFQDIVRVEMTKTSGGDFELLMEMAGPVPVNPRMPPPANHEIWWVWVFDLDPATSPQGYPFGVVSGKQAEFIVYVSWNGTQFAGTAIDRRPLLTGGEAIITPVPFNINGAIIEANLPFELIGDVAPGFVWRARTLDWSGRVGSSGYHEVDTAETI